ncbi:MAG: hypothetical protein WC655_10390 [Candidatus Hydrogenedentales bacterium]|jgi:hypothetical protein
MASLTKRQIAFIDGVARGMTPTEAVRQAGYGPTHLASQYAYRLQRTPAVQLALRARLKARIETTLIPNALSVIEEVLLDPAQPGGVRMKAAQLALQAGNFFGTGSEDNGARTLLSQMSLADLERLAEAQMAEAGLLQIEHDGDPSPVTASEDDEEETGLDSAEP